MISLPNPQSSGFAAILRRDPRKTRWADVLSTVVIITVGTLGTRRHLFSPRKGRGLTQQGIGARAASGVCVELYVGVGIPETTVVHPVVAHCASVGCRNASVGTMISLPNPQSSGFAAILRRDPRKTRWADVLSTVVIITVGTLSPSRHLFSPGKGRVVADHFVALLSSINDKPTPALACCIAPIIVVPKITLLEGSMLALIFRNGNRSISKKRWVAKNQMPIGHPAISARHGLLFQSSKLIHCG